MKTAQSIEAIEARKEQTDNGEIKYPRGTHPNSHGNNLGKKYNKQVPVQPPAFIANKWQPGQSGNPSGKPKQDVANIIARAVFENNKEQLYDAFLKAALKGNAYAFQQLADRAYGKLKERVEISPGEEFREMSSEALSERVKQLEAKLGITVSTDAPRGAGVDPIRALPPTIKTED